MARKNDEWTLDIKPSRNVVAGRGRAEILDRRILHPHEEQILHEGRMGGWAIDVDTVLTLYALSKMKQIAIQGVYELGTMLDEILDYVESAPPKRRKHREDIGRDLLNNAVNRMLDTIDVGLDKLQEEVARSVRPAKFLEPKRLGLLARLLGGGDARYDY